MKMKKVISLIYFFIFVTLVILNFTGYKTAGYEIYQPLHSEDISVIEPVEIVKVSEDRTEFYFALENSSRVEQCVEVYTNHQRVNAYIDGELIYTLVGGDSIWGKTTGSKFNFISCPQGSKELKLVIEAIYPEVRNHEFDFFYGEGMVIYQQILKNSIMSLLSSVLIIFTGVFMASYWIVMHKKALINPGLLFFGIFTAIIGAWIMTETDFMTLVAENRAVQSFIGYTLIMTLVVPFVMYIKYFLEAENWKVVIALCSASIIDVVVCVSLHMTGIREFKQTVYITHILIIMALIYMGVCLIVRFMKMGFDSKVRTNAIGAGLLAFTVVIDLFVYYKRAQGTGIVGGIGFLVYILLLGIDNTSEAIKQINIGRKAELYREMALTDLLTGLYNRNAFDSWEKENKEFSGTMLVTFDLNNLKWCNDTLGHALGDKYIADAAGMIRRVFGKLGVCYRIGGDEFCVVIKHANRIDIEVYLERLRRLQKEYNAHSKDVKIQIACGYAVFSETDYHIENTRSRADVSMYENKKNMKNA